MKTLTVICSLILSSLVVVPPMLAQTPAGVRLQSGIAKEDVDGDLKSAIDIYQKIAADASAPRDVRSKALLRLAGCYEKLGRQATQVYEQVIRDFADQPAATQARNRLVALRPEASSAPSMMTQRKIELPLASTLAYKGLKMYVLLSILPTDGYHVLYKDVPTGALMMSDLAGLDKRVILKPKAGEQIESIFPSRDFSSVLLGLRTDDGPKSVVLKTDGTGYRETASVGGNLSSACGPPDWSWDERYLFDCLREPGAPQRTGQVRRVSVTDGEIRNLGRSQGPVNRPSPDGRFIASALSEDVVGKVWITPTSGGEPELVSENAQLVDWTRDGRYLIVTSSHSGSEAVHLLPIKDGKAAGDPVFVRYGPCYFGSTVGNGGLVCHSTHPGDGLEAWLGSLWILENFEPKQQAAK